MVQCIACVAAAEEPSTISVVVTILSTVFNTSTALINVYTMTHTHSKLCSYELSIIPSQVCLFELSKQPNGQVQ